MATRVARTWPLTWAALIPVLAMGAEPPAAYQVAARDARIPAVVLFAVALQESGMQWRGRLIPWPWTLNVAGRAYRLQTRHEACAALLGALAAWPKTRIDVGLGQINVGYHGHRVDEPCDLLDPYRNLAISASILSEQHRVGSDWLITVGRYHRPAGGEAAGRYRQSVERHLLRLTGSHAQDTFAQERPAW